MDARAHTPFPQSLNRPPPPLSQYGLCSGWNFGLVLLRAESFLAADITRNHNRHIGT